MRLIMPILLCVAAVGLFFVYTDPLYQSVKDLQVKRAQYSYALDEATQIRERRDALLQTRSQFSDTDIQKIQKMLPDNVDNIRLIIDINDIAARYHLTAKNVSLSNAGQGQGGGAIGTGATPIGSVTLGFAVTATYPEFLTFLSDLERSLRLIDVESIKFSTGTSDQTDYSLLVQTYWLH